MAREELEVRVLDIFVTIIGGSEGPTDILRYNEESKNMIDTNSKRIQYDKDVGVYNFVEQLRDINVIGVKWVYMLKFNNNRILLERKARIVAHGFSQIQEVDFENTYMATVRLESYYLLLAIVALKKLHLW